MTGVIPPPRARRLIPGGKPPKADAAPSVAARRPTGPALGPEDGGPASMPSRRKAPQRPVFSEVPQEWFGPGRTLTGEELFWLQATAFNQGLAEGSRQERERPFPFDPDWQDIA